MALSRPSLSSHSLKPLPILVWKWNEYHTMTGMGRSTIRVRGTFMLSMNVMDSATRIRMRNSWVICPATKLRVVSMSDVQRWMMSPVWFFMCQLKGRCSMWV